ncbi:MAG: hypothetical protein AB7S26_21520 [Sandaracinaceae bacterium]
MPRFKAHRLGARTLLGCLVLAIAACRPPAAPATPATPTMSVEARTARSVEARTATRVAWPSALLVSASERPAFFRRASSDGGFAWVGGEAEARVVGAPRRGRVRVAIAGPLRVRGWVPVERLEGIVNARGRVEGTPIYLTPGDRVALRSAAGEDATVEVSAHLGHPQLDRTTSFRGTVPLAHLGASLEGVGEGPTPGRPTRLMGPLQLFDRPDGEAVAELPALSPPLPATVLREQGDWLGVRVGLSPYLIGYVRRDATLPSSGVASKQSITSEVLDPWRGRTPQPEPSEGGPGTEVYDPWGRSRSLAELPPRLREARVRPVWCVRSGTRVRVDGAMVARFDGDGYAIEIERDGNRVEILGAIDDTLTVRGIVDATDLRRAGAFAEESVDEGEGAEDASEGDPDEAE